MYGFYMRQDMQGYFRVNQVSIAQSSRASGNATLDGDL